MRFYSFVAAALSFTGVAHAGIIQLTSSSPLSPSDNVVTFPPATRSNVVTGPQTFAAGGNTLTFTNATNTFEHDTAGYNYGGSGFANGTNILFSAGFQGSAGPVTATFAQGVTEFGFNAEDFNGGDELFSLSVFNGTALLGTFTETGNDPNALAFLGAQATGSSVITSFTLSDLNGNNIAVGPVTFGSPARSSVTPEPSSLALLGTGITGVAGLLRRKRR